MPPRHFSSVLLPEPLRPTMPKNSPGSTLNDTSRRATMSDPPRLRSGCSARSLRVCTRSRGMKNRFATPSTRTAGSASGTALTPCEASGAEACASAPSPRALIGEVGGLLLQPERQEAGRPVERRQRFIEQAEPADAGDVARPVRLAERGGDPAALVALGHEEVEVLRAVVGLNGELRDPDPRAALAELRGIRMRVDLVQLRLHRVEVAEVVVAVRERLVAQARDPGRERVVAVHVQ